LRAEATVALSKFYMLDYWRDSSPETLFILDRENFTLSSSAHAPMSACLAGYDLIVEEKPGVWQRRAARIDLDEVSAAGLKITSVRGMKEGSREVHIDTDQGTLWLYHPQECCERVELVDVAGDPEDLVGGIIVVFEHRTEKSDFDEKKNRSHPQKKAKIKPYSFYAIRTTKGDVTLRWEKLNDAAYGSEVIVRFKEA
jgi:hypothetical protein